MLYYNNQFSATSNRKLVGSYKKLLYLVTAANILATVGRQTLTRKFERNKV